MEHIKLLLNVITSALLIQYVVYEMMGWIEDKSGHFNKWFVRIMIACTIGVFIYSVFLK